MSADLTERERHILACLAMGATKAEIAAALWVSLDTIKSQTASAYRKLDAHTAAQAVAEGMRRGVIA